MFKKLKWEAEAYRRSLVGLGL